MLTDWREEWHVRKALKGVARQRVSMILQPGNWWVVERAVSDMDYAAQLRTCHMRGWVEPLVDAVPVGQLGPNGELPAAYSEAPIYRLTEAGWNVIHRTHTWVIVTCGVAVATLLATILAIYITLLAAGVTP